MTRRRLGLALLAGGAATFVGGSYLAARALSKRLISAEGLGPTTARREDLLDALRESGASVHDFRHPGSARDPVTLAAISERQHISLSYLEQLFGKLRRASLVSSVRGPGGGYNLAQPAQGITVADIVSAVDEPLDATQCGGKENCHDEKR